MSDVHRADKRDPERVRLRRHHRQIAAGFALAVLVLVDQHAFLGAFEVWLSWVEVAISSALAGSVLAHKAKCLWEQYLQRQVQLALPEAINSSNREAPEAVDDRTH